MSGNMTRSMLPRTDLLASVIQPNQSDRLVGAIAGNEVGAAQVVQAANEDLQWGGESPPLSSCVMHASPLDLPFAVLRASPDRRPKAQHCSTCRARRPCLQLSAQSRAAQRPHRG